MRPIAALALIAGLAGCDTLSGGPDYTEVRQPGLFAPWEANPLAVPDTVTAGEYFGAVVTTIGGGCIRAGEVLVDAERPGRTATLQPIDIARTTEDGVCTADLLVFPRAVALAFDEPGLATVRAVGRVQEGGTSRDTTVERTVVVRPRG